MKKKRERERNEDVVYYEETNQIKLQWTREETYSFNANEYVMMDSLIELIDSSDNPQTEVVKFSINPTLFEEGDI